MATGSAEYHVVDGMVEIAPFTRIEAAKLVEQLKTKGFSVQEDGQHITVSGIPIPDDMLARIDPPRVALAAQMNSLADLHLADDSN